MPNIIELNLLENRSIVAKMQGIPLANENSYKIIAGEENATTFKVVSIPNQYKDKSFTIEMVNAKGYGIEETPIENINSYEFSLPVGMAVAGYAYILFRAKYIENGKQVVVPFQSLKIKVWNTLPNWIDAVITESSSLKIENNHLYSYENGVWVDIGSVGGGGSVDLSNYVQKTEFDDEVIASITNNEKDLSDDEKTSACEWLGAVRDIDIGDVILTKDINKDTGFLYFGINCYSDAIPQRDGQGKLRTNTPVDTDDETTVTNKKYVDDAVPIIYTDSNQTTTTKTLNIYTDSNGYLHIDTE